MSTSTTIQRILERHQSNTGLSAPFLAPVPSDPSDLAGDQPSSPPAEGIIERAARALREGQTHYVDVPGIAALREVIVRDVERTGSVGYTVDTAVVTAGIQESRFLSIQSLVGEDGVMALPEVVHPGARKAAGLRPLDVRTLPVDAAAGSIPTVDGIRAALESGVRLLYLESPVRLTGAVFGTEQVAAIADLLTQFDAHVIIDQGLTPWVDPGARTALAGRADMRERVTLIGELFPGRGLEGWGIGYLATTSSHVGTVTKWKQVMSICTSTPSQFAALAAAEDDDEARAALSERLGTERQAAAEAAEAAGFTVEPGVALSVIAVRHTRLDEQRAALEAAGVRCAEGRDFGAADVLRLAVTTSGTTAKALAQLR